MEFTEQKLLERYQQLCAQRDATYAQTAPLEKELEKLNAKAEEFRVKAAEVASQIDALLDANHFARKKEIALLAKTLGRPNGPLAKK
jgi:uncharacterized coiled-coil DUF342 family protein